MSREVAGVHQQLQMGETIIPYTVTYTRRKTLGITIYPESRPELRVQVRAPLEVNAATVAEIVLKRAPWILKHLRALENRPPKQPPPGYVNGTTHWYLGHPYPLQVESLVGTELAREQVKLDKTALTVWTRNPHNARRVEALVEGSLSAVRCSDAELEDAPHEGTLG
jgi:predicted metal-dependent hydrolase